MHLRRPNIAFLSYVACFPIANSVLGYARIMYTYGYTRVKNRNLHIFLKTTLLICTYFTGNGFGDKTRCIRWLISVDSLKTAVNHEIGEWKSDRLERLSGWAIPDGGRDEQCLFGKGKQMYRIESEYDMVTDCEWATMTRFEVEVRVVFI